MKSKFIFLPVILFIFLTISCQNSIDETIISSSLDYGKLSKDEDFNAVVQILAKQQIELKITEENSKKIGNWSKHDLDINSVDINEVSEILGYSNVEIFRSDLKKLESLGNKLRIKYPDLSKSQEVIHQAVIRSNAFKEMSTKNLRVMRCDKAMLAACIAGAYGTYVVVITSNCPGAAVLGPWGVGACIAGASIAYGAGLYTCGQSYGCNNE